MAEPVLAFARAARLLKAAGALVVLAAIVSVVLAMGGRKAAASTALQLAVPLVGAALLMAAVLFIRSRRYRQDQDPS